MGIEYKIKFSVPQDYDSSALLNHLPSPIHRATMTEIYNYKVEQYGFYFIDHLVDEKVAAVAFNLNSSVSPKQSTYKSGTVRD